MVKEKEINPFVVNSTLRYFRKESQKIITYDSDEDYQHSGTIIKSHFLVEADRKVSMYVPSVKEMDEKILGLSLKAKSILWYVQIHLVENTDYIRLPYKVLINKCGISRNSVMLGLRELKAAGLITDKAQSVYWVNPKYFFSGNRLRFYSKVNKDIIEEV